MGARAAAVAVSSVGARPEARDHLPRLGEPLTAPLEGPFNARQGSYQVIYVIGGHKKARIESRLRSRQSRHRSTMTRLARLTRPKRAGRWS
jgi:hypothetical protein